MRHFSEHLLKLRAVIGSLIVSWSEAIHSYSDWFQVLPCLHVFFTWHYLGLYYNFEIPHDFPLALPDLSLNSNLHALIHFFTLLEVSRIPLHINVLVVTLFSDCLDYHCLECFLVSKQEALKHA